MSQTISIFMIAKINVALINGFRVVLKVTHMFAVKVKMW